jgi:hypothetical protein
MSLLLLSFFAIWLFSIFAFAKWRNHSKLQREGILTNPLNDWATNLFLKVTSIILLVLFFYVIFQAKQG